MSTTRAPKTHMGQGLMLLNTHGVLAATHTS